MKYVITYLRDMCFTKVWIQVPGLSVVREASHPSTHNGDETWLLCLPIPHLRALPENPASYILCSWVLISFKVR